VKTAVNNEHIRRLSEALGYQFIETDWLVLALTHRSVSGNRNNERLEFLGDSILNFIIADYLYQTFPEEKEGRLSRLRSSLVKQDTLAELARDLKLGDYLRLGPGELKSGGYRRDSILADTVEAILGAIYRDCGNMDRCHALVLAWFGPRLQAVGEEATLKDSKSRLQEYLQSRHLALPSYTVVSVDGEAHNQHFMVSAQIPGLEELTWGEGASRRHAEQEAAAKALVLLNVKE
jgi:ribonuclease-3